MFDSSVEREPVRVLGAALDVHRGVGTGVEHQPVVAGDLGCAVGPADDQVGRAAEDARRIGRRVPGGVDDGVGLQTVAATRRQVGDLDGHPVVAGVEVDDGRRVHHPQPLTALHPLLVLAAVQLLDELGVDHRVVGAAVGVEQHALDRLVGVEEHVDGIGVEDAVGVGRVVGRRVAPLGEDRAHLGRGEPSVQEVDDLGRALPGADDHEPPGIGRGGHRLDPVEDLAVVPDARAPGHAGGQARLQAGGDGEVAGALHRDLAVGLAAEDVPRHDDVVLGDRLDVDDRAPVRHQVPDACRGPLEVVVELDAQREQRLVVDEVGQPAALVQVVDEAEVAGRVALGDQILQERDLHRRVVEQHPPVPAEPGLALEEADAQGPGGVGRGLLGRGDGEPEVGGPEADAQDVEDVVAAERGDARVRAGEVGHRSAATTVLDAPASDAAASIEATRLRGRMSVQLAST